jgi:hypothetical protein
MIIGIVATLRSGNIMYDGKGYLARSAICALTISSVVHLLMGEEEPALVDEEVYAFNTEIEGKMLAHGSKSKETRLAPEKDSTTEKAVGG